MRMDSTADEVFFANATTAQFNRRNYPDVKTAEVMLHVIF